MSNETYMGRFYEGEDAKTIIGEMQEKINHFERLITEYKPQPLKNFKYLQILPVWQNIDDELPENGMIVDVWIKNEKTGQELRKPFVKYDKDCFNINLAEGFKIIAWIYINDYAF